MAIGWMRLDRGFWHDPKFAAIIDAKGEAGAFRALKLYSLASENYGRLDFSDRPTRIWVEGEMGLKGKKLDEFMEACLECGVFDRGHYEAFGVFTSRRLSEEGEKRRRTEEARACAGSKGGRPRESK